MSSRSEMERESRMQEHTEKMIQGYVQIPFTVRCFFGGHEYMHPAEVAVMRKFLQSLLDDGKVIPF